MELLAELEGDKLAEAELLGESDALSLPLGEIDALGEIEALADPLGLILADSENPLGEAEGD